MFWTLHTSPYNGHLWPPTLVPELHDHFICPQPTLSLGSANAGEHSPTPCPYTNPTTLGVQGSTEQQ